MLCSYGNHSTGPNFVAYRCYSEDWYYDGCMSLYLSEEEVTVLLKDLNRQLEMGLEAVRECEQEQPTVQFRMRFKVKDGKITMHVEPEEREIREKYGAPRHVEMPRGLDNIEEDE